MDLADAEGIGRPDDLADVEAAFSRSSTRTSENGPGG
jgi:hypothetical protein